MYVDKSNLNVLFAVKLVSNDHTRPTKCKQYLEKFYPQHKGKDKRFFERYKLRSYYENTILICSKHYTIELWYSIEYRNKIYFKLYVWLG